MNSEDGVPDNYIETTYTDSDGFLWIGSQDGLSYYDGYSFKNFQKIFGDSTSLTSNYIYTVFEDRTNQLWVGTNLGGLLRFDRKTQTFTPFSKISEQASIRSIAEDQKGNIWVGTFTGLFKILPSRDSVVPYSISKKSIDSKNEEMIRSISVSHTGMVWFGAQNRHSLSYYDEQLDSILSYENNELKALLENDFLRTIAEDHKGNLWLGTAHSGIIKLNINTNWLEVFNTKQSAIVGNEIQHIYIDSLNRVWYGTINRGLGVFDKDMSHTKYNEDYLDNNSLPSSSISHINQDVAGNYWIATHGGGLAQCKLVDGGFVHYKMKKNHPQGISHSIVSCFMEDPDGGIWVGTDGGGLNYFDRSKGAFKAFTTENGLGSNVVLDMIPADSESMWITGWEHGLTRFYYQSKNIISQKVSEQTNGLVTNNIKALFRAKDGILWLGNHSLDGVTYVFDDNQPEEKNQFGGLHRDIVWVNQFVQDQMGAIWVATNRGLYMYSDSLFLFSEKHTLEYTIASDHVTTVYNDKKGNLWVGTNAGLLKYNYNTKAFSNYSIQYGLPTNIKGILDDTYGNLWISTKDGLLKFHPQTGEKQLFDAHSGLQGNHFYERSCFESSTGEMYFGGLNGFTAFDPTTINFSKSSPSLVMTDFQVFNESRYDLVLNVSKEDALYDYYIELESDMSVISFEYAVLSFWATHKNEYKYILEGFDESWHNVLSEHKATYTNLDPGNYVFRVKGANHLGVWNEDGISVGLTILPPFWLTWWFKFIVVLVILSLFFAIYTWRLKAFKMQKVKLEYEVKRRTHELKHLNSDLVEQKEEVEHQNEQLEAQKYKLEEYNDAILRKTGEVLIQREKIIDQNILLEKKNKELDQLVKTKDKFFSIIAHDLKNPINAIMGFSDLMLRRFETISHDRKHEFVKHINLSANLVYNLLINLLDWARSQSQNLVAKPKEYALEQIFTDNILLMSDLAKSKEIKLVLALDKDVNVFADINILNTILRNLISNAIKYTNRSGEIEIGAFKQGDSMVCIYVKDSGLGMSEKKINTLFSVDKNTSTNGTEHEQGTGLGLLVVKEFVHANGGEISVKSEEGKGSTFTFTVPVAKSQVPTEYAFSK